MTSSGTEAAMSAIRLARAATGRERIRQVRRAPTTATSTPCSPRRARAWPRSGPAIAPGYPRRPRRRPPWCPGTTTRRSTRPSATTSPPSWPSRSRPTWASSRPRTASSSTCARPPTRTGALLVLDEVITGFRVGRGGAQELAGIMPDLTILGKVLGGGLPAAAYGGRRDLMERIAPAGDVYQAGTLSGNPLAVAAGLATLRALDDDAYHRLAPTTAALAEGMRERRRRRARPGRRPPGPLHRLLLRRAGSRLRRAPPPATARPTPPGAARCWPGASIRRPRSSRPGSPPSPTTPSTSSGRWTRPRAAFGDVAAG